MIRETIRKKRRELEISQAELAKQVGCTQSTIANFEGGKSAISSHTLDHILKALEINLT